MKIIFGRSNTLISALIRLVTWSRYSHVGIVHEDVVIESRALAGVVTTPIESFISRYNTIEFAEVQGDARDALDYVGTRYDWSAIFGIFFRTGWDDDQKLVCSELIGLVSNLFRKNRTGRVTPEHIYMISKPLGEK